MNSGEILELVTERLGEAVLSTHAFRGDATIVVDGGSFVEAARFLKEEPQLAMDFLMDLSAVDYSAFGKGPAPAFFSSSGVAVQPEPQIPDPEPWPGPPSPERFAVVAHFYSMRHKHRARIVAPVSEREPEIGTLTGLWAGANWLEREVWDMFGIRFRGHPDLRRILLYEEFEGYPLRRDYPVDKRQPLIGPHN